MPVPFSGLYIPSSAERPAFTFPQAAGSETAPDDSAFTPRLDLSTAARLLDERYQAENALLAAIRSGSEEASLDALNNMANATRKGAQLLFPSFSDSLADARHACIVMDTLFRKAVEEAGVHPIYIHETSDRFTVRIETAEEADELLRMMAEMTVAYTRLVRECSRAEYSEPVRQAMLYVDMHISDVLSTRNIARVLYLTPNYLSSRFHKETGQRVTDYILERRLNIACRILEHTKIPVGDIGTMVGIPDAGYFSRLFKRRYNVSPLQYRKERTEAAE